MPTLRGRLTAAAAGLEPAPSPGVVAASLTSCTGDTRSDRQAAGSRNKFTVGHIGRDGHGERTNKRGLEANPNVGGIPQRIEL